MFKIIKIVQNLTGSHGTHVYIIIEGECAVHRLGRTATRNLGTDNVDRKTFGQSIIYLGPGDSFGEAATESRHDDNGTIKKCFSKVFFRGVSVLDNLSL